MTITEAFDDLVSVMKNGSSDEIIMPILALKDYAKALHSKWTSILNDS